jgi:hypothetical protein
MTPQTLNKMTVKALRDLARELSVAGYTRMKKAELVDAIAACQREPAKAPQAAMGTMPPPVEATSSAGSAPPQRHAPRLSDLGDLPARYGRTRATLMVQKPDYLYAYWEILDEDLAAARASMGRVEARLVMRAHNVSAGIHTDIEVHAPVGDWFFKTDWAGNRVKVEIGLKGPDGRFIVLAVSNEVDLPSAKASDRVDPEWAIQEDQFEAIYALSGGFSPGDSAQLQRLMREGWGPSSGDWRR